MPKHSCDHASMSFTKMRSIFFFTLIVLLAIAVLYLFRPFFYPIFWAAIIAVMFHPWYMWLNKHMKMPGLSAFIGVILVLVALVLPLILIALLLVHQSIQLYSSTSPQLLNPENVTKLLDLPLIAPYVETAKDWWANSGSEVTKNVGAFVLTHATRFTQFSFLFLAQTALMLYTLYYFFKDGPRMLKRLMHLSPLGDKYEKMLYERFRSTSSATLKSTLIIGGIQGILGGVLFWVTGVPGAFVWGVIMTILSIIPAVGSVLVWLPAGIVMLALGNVWQGVTILVFGGVVISVIDNVLRPPLIGKDTQMHPLVVLFSTLGGLALFGISGFVVGPIIAALFISVMSIYDYYYKNELSSN